LAAWRTEATDGDIDYVRYGRLIRYALDFVPVASIPRAVAHLRP
jgi:hypothetical protein